MSSFLSGYAEPVESSASNQGLSPGPCTTRRGRTLVDTKSTICAERNPERCCRDADGIVYAARCWRTSASQSCQRRASSKSHPRALLHLLSCVRQFSRHTCLLAHQSRGKATGVTPNPAVQEQPTVLSDQETLHNRLSTRSGTCQDPATGGGRGHTEGASPRVRTGHAADKHMAGRNVCGAGAVPDRGRSSRGD